MSIKLPKEIELKLLEVLSELQLKEIYLEEHYYAHIILEGIDKNQKLLNISIVENELSYKNSDNEDVKITLDKELINNIVKFIREYSTKETVIKNILENEKAELEDKVKHIKKLDFSDLEKRYKKMTLALVLGKFYNRVGNLNSWVDVYGLGYGWAYQFKEHLSDNKNLKKNEKALKNIYKDTLKEFFDNNNENVEIYELTIRNNDKILMFFNVNEEDELEYILESEHFVKIFYFSNLPLLKAADAYIF